MSAAALLDPGLVQRLGRLRLSLRRRVDGRFVGGHPARGYGSSQDFADYRDYTPGDDPRLVDPHAWRRHGRLLVRLYAAEDTAAVSIVVDLSASMAFAGKDAAARKVAAALATVAVSGGDRVRVVPVSDSAQLGPWYTGTAGIAALTQRLVDSGDPSTTNADLLAALHMVRGRGPRGPVVIISDLLTPQWPQIVAQLGAERGDALIVHLLGRDELDPQISGDVRLVDVESGNDVELAITPAALARYRTTRDAWFDALARACGARAVSLVRHVADEPVEHLVSVQLRRLGWVA